MKTLRGFTLIELIIGMAIFGVLLSIAIPAFTNWLRNARVRTAAESVQNGLQLARAEAVRRNTTVRFQLVDSIGSDCKLTVDGPHWVVSLDDPAGKCEKAPADDTAPRIIQLRSGAEGSAASTLLSGQSSFAFNSLGRLTTPAASVDLSSPTAACMDKGGPVRCLRVVVSGGGQIRMCDPKLPAGDAQGGCP